MTMENEKKIPTAARELSDEEVSQAAGGLSFALMQKKMGPVTIRETPYQWVGTDVNLKYLCPDCHLPVHTGVAWRYCCDACGKGWFDESKLERNLDSGGWVETESCLKDMARC